jgi:hypothetical protein
MAMRALLGGCFVASLFFSVQPVAADPVAMILIGKVTMPDGTPPPFTVAIERVCDDVYGTAQGPVANKKGEYSWRMDVDPLSGRKCYLHANSKGYTSNRIDISDLDGSLGASTTLSPIVLAAIVADPYIITTGDSGVPSRAAAAWKAALKALDGQNLPEAITQFKAVIAAVPKFAPAWHAIGVVQEAQSNLAEARDAYQHAIEADPKLIAAYVTLTRVELKAKDWAAAAKGADVLIKVDSKKVYPESYLHQAVARYQLKDLDGAAASAQQAIQLKVPRAEYVLGRVLEAKGDAAGARDHIGKYLQQDKNTPDAEEIRAHLENIGKPDAVGSEPDLEKL